MTTTDRKPLALVVEDDPEWREKLIVPQLEALGARLLTASNVLDGVRLAADHGRDSKDPLDLVILDMHMPLTDQDADPYMEGGVVAMRQYADLEVRCPVVVFTAYPSYSNCMAAVQAGAYAYIPKEKNRTPKGTEGGIDDLVDLCRRILGGNTDEQPVMPPREWQQRNRSWLLSRFSGKWVAFVRQGDRGQDPALEVSPDDVCEGIFVLSGNTRKEVCTMITASPALFRTLPPIAMVVKFEQDRNVGPGSER